MGRNEVERVSFLDTCDRGTLQYQILQVERPRILEKAVNFVISF